jgi:ABC-2 type transport system permease protein
MNWNKLGLIIKREYVTRVRTKGFIIGTLLAPLGILVLFLVPIGLQLLDSDSDPKIAVIDYTSEIANRLYEQDSSLYTVVINPDIEEVRSNVQEDIIQGYLIISPDVLEGVSDPEFIYSTGGLDLAREVRGDVRQVVKDALLDRAQVNGEVRSIIDRNIGLVTRKLTDEGEKEEDVTAMYLVGNVMGFFLYFAIFIYGAFVMRGVIEEKSSRILEVIASSVKPFELLMGKVLGIGAVGMTQFIAWTLLTQGILLISAPLAASMLGTGGTASGTEELPFTPPEISVFTWLAFIVFFIFGYLIYSAMFAAIGSAVDNEQDAQNLQWPVTIPVIIPMLLLGAVVSDPTSTLAVVSSMIPFFSPILMMVRIAIIDVPLWQSLGSVVLMILTFLALIWASARIYRIGILMYGKKPTIGEVIRWARQA